MREPPASVHFRIMNILFIIARSLGGFSRKWLGRFPLTSSHVLTKIVVVRQLFYMVAGIQLYTVSFNHYSLIYKESN